MQESFFLYWKLFNSSELEEKTNSLMADRCFPPPSVSLGPSYCTVRKNLVWILDNDNEKIEFQYSKSDVNLADCAISKAGKWAIQPVILNNSMNSDDFVL